MGCYCYLRLKLRVPVGVVYADNRNLLIEKLRENEKVSETILSCVPMESR